MRKLVLFIALAGCISSYGQSIIVRNRTLKFPTAITSGTLEGWYDVGYSGNTVTSGTVRSIVDLSGKGRTMNSGTAFPVYSSSGGPNNKPYMTIDISHALAATGFNLGTPAMTVYIVMKQNDLTNNFQNGFSNVRTIVDFHADRQNGVYNTDTPNSTLGDRMGTMIRNNTNYTSDKNFTRTDRWCIVSASINNSSTFFKINKEYNSLYQPATFTVPTTTVIMFSIGNYQFPSFSANFGVSELIAVSGSISSVEDKAILDYLESKYQTQDNPGLEAHGDSITLAQGGGVSQWEGYPALIAYSKGLNYTNFGVAGSTVEAAGVGAGVPGSNFEDIYQTSLAQTPWNQYKIFAYGRNDWFYGIVNTGWKSRYKAFVQLFIDRGYPKSKMMMMSTFVPSANQASYAQTRQYISEIASELGILYYDCQADFNANGGSSLLRDGVHPNAAGYVIMTNGMLAILP